MPRHGGHRLNIRRWLPPVAWAAVIITATSMPSGVVPQGVGSYDKAAHFGMYAIFGYLLTRDGFGVAGRWWSAVLAVIVASGFGAVDEWHQQYIPGRSTELADWHADTLGAIAGAFAYAIFRRRRPHTSHTS